MKLDFQAIPETVVPNFKDGEGEAHIRKYNDPQMGSIVNITLPVGSSIGLHTHKGNCEIVYVLSGAGTYIDDGETSPLTAGMTTYCPEGHSHSIINTGKQPLVLLGVLPDSKESK